MAIIQYIFPFVVLIIILVFVHELGHFLAAKLCGVRASVFAVGMGPRVFGWNKITGFTFGKIAEDLDLGNHTDYRLSALPFGGYVKIEGMIDESMDEDFTNKPPQQWEFRTKNYFQKIFIMSAGVIMNLILAISIYTVLNMYNGRILSNTNQVGFLPESGSAYVHGLRSNDKIISINGNPIKYFEEINEEIYLKNNDKDISIKVDRNGTISDIIIPKSEVILSTKNSNILIPYSSNTFLTIESPVDGSPAEKAGIKPGDIINKIDAIDIYNSQQFRDYLDKTNGKDVNITLTRDSKLINLKVTPNLDNKIGVSISDKYHGETTTLNYKFTEAFGAGIHQIGIIIEQLYLMIKRLFSGEAKLKDSVGGPIAIAKAAKQWFVLGLIPFLTGMAYLSVTLAIMNILPFPVLDGGHIVILTIESVIRKEIPIKAKIWIQQAGMILFLLLTVFVFYNDLMKE